MDLSPEAKIEHARDVIELTKICHSDLFCDGIGTIDVNRGRIPSSKMSQNSKVKGNDQYKKTRTILYIIYNKDILYI